MQKSVPGDVESIYKQLEEVIVFPIIINLQQKLCHHYGQSEGISMNENKFSAFS